MSEEDREKLSLVSRESGKIPVSKRSMQICTLTYSGSEEGSFVSAGFSASEAFIRTSTAPLSSLVKAKAWGKT